MYSPTEQEEYVPEAGMSNFSVQALSDALMTLEQGWPRCNSPLWSLLCNSRWWWQIAGGIPILPGSGGMQAWSCTCLRVILCLGTSSTSRCMGWEQPTCSLTNKADDSFTRLHRSSRCMSEKLLWSWFPALLTLLWTPFLSLRDGATVTALEWCTHCWWEEYQGPTTIPMLASSKTDSASQLVPSAPTAAARIESGEAGGGWPARVPPLGHVGGLPRLDLPWEAEKTCPHPLLRGESRFWWLL